MLIMCFSTHGVTLHNWRSLTYSVVAAFAPRTLGFHHLNNTISQQHSIDLLNITLKGLQNFIVNVWNFHHALCVCMCTCCSGSPFLSLYSCFIVCVCTCAGMREYSAMGIVAQVVQLQLRSLCLRWTSKQGKKYSILDVGQEGEISTW